MIVEHLFHDPVESHRRQLQTPHALLSSMVVQQALDQLLQCTLFAGGFLRFRVARRERPGGPLDQQLGSFTKRRQRRFQLVRDVPQEQALLLFELDQPLTQPIEPAAQVFQSAGPPTRMSPSNSPAPRRRIAWSSWRIGLAMRRVTPAARSTPSGIVAASCSQRMRCARSPVRRMDSTSRSIKALLVLSTSRASPDSTK